jgi:methylamine---glutamate N-methyltransferase subunit C
VTLSAAGFPEVLVRGRARSGAASAFPAPAEYGTTLFGAGLKDEVAEDEIDLMRLVPPVFMPRRLEKLVELAREPMHTDVELATDIGGLRSALPVYVSAFGSTQVASSELAMAVSRQAGRSGIPMVIGENVVPVNGYRQANAMGDSLLGRIHAYASESQPDIGGVAVQQSTQDADTEVWNQVYSDPSVRPLLDSGRLAFELKVGQGAKPGLGGITIVDRKAAARLAGYFMISDIIDGCGALRYGSPGTFTEEILRQQIRSMRNNYPRARIWVKLPPGRDVGVAAATAWGAGADAVTVDGAAGGTGWAPLAFLDHVGLPLAECLRRIEPGSSCLLVSSRMWEGVRAVKSLALGARAVGLGRAAMLAADENADNGLVNLISCMALELRLLISALGKYRAGHVSAEDIWPVNPRQSRWEVPGDGGAG